MTILNTTLITLTLITLYLYRVEVKKKKSVCLIRNGNIMTYNPTTIANYFIQEKSKTDRLTSMKLIKLVYLAYSWYITLNGKEKPLTDEKAQAWKYGPVFPSLYNVIKKEGKIVVTEPLPNNKQETILTSDKEFLEKIWGLYGKYDGVQLSAMTHAEGTPWRNVYCRDCNTVIPDESIIEHYEPKLKPAS